MAFSRIFGLLCLVSLAAGIEVLYPASGNTWDLDQVNSYNVFWKSHASDPTHVHVALHDAAGNVVDSYESVKTSSGSYLISGISGITTGSNYHVVLSDPSAPNIKIFARSGKFSIRQRSGASSSDVQIELPTTSTQPAVTYTPSTLFSTSTELATTLSSYRSTISTASSETSTTFGSSTTSSSTATSPAASTGFPKFQLPSKTGLSGGSIAGIVVGVIVLLLIVLGAGYFFWRKRRQLQSEEEARATLAEHHGKAELVGDQARSHEHDPKVAYAQRSELDTDPSPARSSAGDDRQHEIQPAPSAMVELPQQTSNQIPVHEGNLVELGSSSPHPNTYNTEYTQTGPSHGTENDMQQNQNAVELPARSESRINNQSPDSPPVQTATSIPSPEERSITSAGPSASSSSTTAAAAAAAVPAPAPLPQEKSEADDLEALRRRQRSLAESISAAEALERLRREHLEIEERIRIAERAQRESSNGKG